MDERRSVALLGWTVGGIVGVMFMLNAVALALVHGDSPAGSLVASPAGNPLAATVRSAPAIKTNRS